MQKTFDETGGVMKRNHQVEANKADLVSSIASITALHLWRSHFIRARFFRCRVLHHGIALSLSVLLFWTATTIASEVNIVKTDHPTHKLGKVHKSKRAGTVRLGGIDRLNGAVKRASFGVPFVDDKSNNVLSPENETALTLFIPSSETDGRISSGALATGSGWPSFTPSIMQFSPYMTTLTSPYPMGAMSPQTIPVFPTPVPEPTGLIVGNGGIVGTTTQLLGSTSNSLFSNNSGYITNGSLQVNNANFSQGYTVVSVLGVPVVTLNPVGTLLTTAGGTLIGGTGYNSHLTLLGGVTSDSYIYDINNGGPTGLLGIALPGKAPAWSSTCLGVGGVATVSCFGVNAAQDYQVLVGDGATANGSKEVVIGTNASHTLPLVDADTAFPGNGRNDPNNPSGVPTADYEARLGHSVVIGDDANGSANAQTLLGAETTSNQPNSVALGYQSSAERGPLSGYIAYGLGAVLQNSAGEVSVGSPGQERQITNVAPGSELTDAVNVAQLEGVSAIATDSVQYDNAAKTSVTLAGVLSTDGGQTNGTVFTNLHQGALSATSTDAINGAQLFATNSNVDNITNIVDAINTDGTKYFQANSVGPASSATGTDAIAAGQSAVAAGQAAVALGSTATASADESVAIGAGASATLANSIAIGQGSTTMVGALTNYSAYGLATLQNSAGELNIGNRQLTGLAPGSESTDAVNVEQLEAVGGQVSALSALTVKYDADASGNPTNTITLTGNGGGTPVTITHLASGAETSISSDAINGSQLWHWTQDTSNQYSTYSLYDDLTSINGGGGIKYFHANSQLGDAGATGTDSVAIGPLATASSTNGIALGNGAAATFDNSIALGSGSVTVVGALTNYSAYGLSAPQTSDGEVNIGNRQLTGLAAGSALSDAVNLEQLESVGSQVTSIDQLAVKYDADASGNPTNQVTLTGASNGAPVLVSNLAPGALLANSTEAINGSQLWHWTEDTTNQYSNYSLFNDIAGLSSSSASLYFRANSTLAPASATGTDSVAAGPGTLASGDNGVAVGNGAAASGTNALAFGTQATASSTDAMALGNGAAATMANSIALGAGSITQVGALTNYQAYGLDTPQTSAGEVNVGNRQITGVAPGSAPNDAVNVEQLEAVDGQLQSVSKLAVLYDADASGNATNTISLVGSGNGAPVGITNVADGVETANSTDAINGSQLWHWTQDIGNIYSNTNLYNDILNLQTGGGSGGTGTKYFHVDSTLPDSTATGSDSIAIGPQASASGGNSVAVGNGASATAADSVAIGSGSTANRDDTVSVGSPGNERQITNVAAGTASTDAANVGQVNSGVQQAVNWADSYTDQRIGALTGQIQQVNNRANAGVAAAMAMAGLPQAYEPGKNMAAVAGSTYRGESSIAIGVSTISESGRWVYKLTGSANTRGDAGVAMGVGMEW